MKWTQSLDPVQYIEAELTRLRAIEDAARTACDTWWNPNGANISDKMHALRAALEAKP